MPPRAAATRRRIPPKRPLTTEAEAELARQGISAESISSAGNIPVYSGPGDEPPETVTGVVINPGAEIDAALAGTPDDPPLIDPEKPVKDTPQTGPPKADEWLDFFSRIILKVGMELYVDFAFRGIDENIVPDTELRKITLRKEERDIIARPFAEFSAKNPYLRKHGRQIVAFTDSAESLMTLGIWMRRVNRTARKYRPPKNRTSNVDSRPYPGTEYGIHGTANGSVPGGFALHNPGSG